MKGKSKIIYSVLLVLIPLLLIIGLTLGWFMPSKENLIDNVDLLYSGYDFKLYKGRDQDRDGDPDKDALGNIIYEWIPSRDVVLSYVFPGYTAAFKIEITTGFQPGYVSGHLNGISLPEDQYVYEAPDPLPDLDLAKEMWLQYKHPFTNENTHDSLLKCMTDLSRDIVLFQDVPHGAESTLTFEFMIYMKSTAGDEYQSMRMKIEEVMFNAHP